MELLIESYLKSFCFKGNKDLIFFANFGFDAQFSTIDFAETN
jgi:hypothetical protein